MKKLIFIPLLFFSLILSATNYYVKNGGNNSETGADDAHAWETIAKVNSFSFSAGDTCFFKRGDTFTGTLTPLASGNSGAYIVFGAYDSGDKPIITPNVDLGETWTVHSGDIWKATLGINPGNILTGSKKKISKINDYWMTHTPADSRYGNIGALALMAVTEAQQYSMKSNGDVYFWDGLDALYCYSSGTTYFRFRGGEDPNDSTFYIAADDSKAAYLLNKAYIVLENLNFMGGEYGILFDGSGTHDCIVRDCKIESSNNEIRTINTCNNIEIDNNEITKNSLSTYKPGCYTGTVTYPMAVYRHLYEFAKYRIDGLGGSSDNVDCGIKMYHRTDDMDIHDNTITNCVCGIYIQGEDCNIYNNTFENASSFGIYFHTSSDGSSAYYNYFDNTNFPFRFNYVDVGGARTNYVYSNSIYIPDAGQAIYIYTSTASLSIIDVYFYNNSFICKTGIALDNRYSAFPTGSTGFVFRNNIFSVSAYNTYGYAGMATNANLFDFTYNWMGGTYVGTSGIAAWATDASNLNHVGDTFWDHADPPDFTDIAGSEVIAAGTDVGIIYDMAGNVYLTPDPSMGSYEIPPVAPTLVELIDVWGTGGATTISSEAGTLQMLKKTLPVNATDTTCVWRVVNGTGTATISITGLLTATSDGTVDARATANDGSEIYGEEEITISNQNPDAGPPVVTTDGIHSRTSISAVFGGEVVSESGGTVSARGVCWNTTGDPTTADSKTVDGSGLGVFESTLTGLKGNTTYYVCAYGTNIEGTGYGDPVSFTTPKITVLRAGGRRLTSGIKGQKYLIISR